MPSLGSLFKAHSQTNKHKLFLLMSPMVTLGVTLEKPPIVFSLKCELLGVEAPSTATGVMGVPWRRRSKPPEL